MIKKTLLIALLVLSCAGLAHAGGILTNTNQSARFGRLFALEAMTNAADAAYYNPAGTVKLSEGFHFTFSNQSAFQERHINTSYPTIDGGDPKLYKGTASAPVIPSLQGVYRKGKWALSGSIAIVGGGGKATFNEGLPMFEVPASTMPSVITANFGGLVTADKYEVTQYMTGTNYIFGAQLGGTYAINDMFSVYAGFRLNIVNNKYEGYLKDLRVNLKSPGMEGVLPAYDGSMTSPQLPLGIMISKLEAIENPSAEIIENINGLKIMQFAASETGAQLNSKQSGWGVAPILGVNFSYDRLNIGAKYEFRSTLDVENKTSIDNTGLFGNGVNTAHDIPALLAVGVSYNIIDPLRVSVGYHHFFDKDAGMANNKQRHLDGNTNEYLFGAEWRIDKMFLVSMGGQVTKYGETDNFQSDLSFSVDSYSLGFGGAVNVSKNIQINVGYFFTDYSDYKMADVDGLSKSYTRKNKVFTAGVDFSF